jgi:hypothetical protein
MKKLTLIFTLLLSIFITSPVMATNIHKLKIYVGNSNTQSMFIKWSFGFGSSPKTVCVNKDYFATTNGWAYPLPSSILLADNTNVTVTAYSKPQCQSPTRSKTERVRPSKLQYVWFRLF